jgi:hypothetical protein
MSLPEAFALAHMNVKRLVIQGTRLVVAPSVPLNIAVRI